MCFSERMNELYYSYKEKSIDEFKLKSNILHQKIFSDEKPKQQRRAYSINENKNYGRKKSRRKLSLDKYMKNKRS